MGIIKVDLAIEEDREMLLELMKCSKGAIQLWVFPEQINKFTD